MDKLDEWIQEYNAKLPPEPPFICRIGKKYLKVLRRVEHFYEEGENKPEIAHVKLKTFIATDGKKEYIIFKNEIDEYLEGELRTLEQLYL